MSVAILRRRKLGRTSTREITNHVREAGLDCNVVLNGRDSFASDVDTVIRWGCTGSTPPGVRIINKASAIHQVNDKANFRMTCANVGLSPVTALDADVWDRFPAVVRPARHAQGRRLYVCNNQQELRDACRRAGEGYYISELINKVAEYRVFVVQGRVAAVAQKTPGNPNDVAWNVARGGRFDNVRFGGWEHAVVEAAVRAFNLTELDFGGVDVMVDRRGNAYVLEINSAPSLTSPYRQQCMGRALAFLVQNPDRLQVAEGQYNWRNYVHPAISDEAEVPEEEMSPLGFEEPVTIGSADLRNVSEPNEVYNGLSQSLEEAWDRVRVEAQFQNGRARTEGVLNPAPVPSTARYDVFEYDGEELDCVASALDIEAALHYTQRDSSLFIKLAS